jgi:23S rRNA maturation mini-RNase III
MRWAANSNVVSPPKHANRQQYKQATALEALVRVQSSTVATKQH